MGYITIRCMKKEKVHWGDLSYMAHGPESLEEFITHLSTELPTIKFISNNSPHQLLFLDLIMFIKQGKLNTRLFTKPTERQI